MSTEPRLIQLIKRLHEETLSSKVRWSETASETAFRIGLGNGMLRIERSDGRNYTTYEVVLLDERGREMRRMVADNDEADFSLNEHFDIFSHLFRAAQDSALRIDVLLDGMMEALAEGKVNVLTPERPVDDIPF